MTSVKRKFHEAHKERMSRLGRVVQAPVIDIKKIKTEIIEKKEEKISKIISEKKDLPVLVPAKVKKKDKTKSIAKNLKKNNLEKDSTRMKQNVSEKTLDNIKEIVCSYFEVEPELLLSKARPLRIMVPRQVCVYFSRILTGASYVQLGKYFERDHATLIYSVNVIEHLLKNNEAMRVSVSYLRSKILGQINITTHYWGV